MWRTKCGGRYLSRSVSSAAVFARAASIAVFVPY